MNLSRSRRLLLFVCLSITLCKFSISTNDDHLTTSSKDDPIINLPINDLQPDQVILMSKTEEKFEFQSDIARLMRVVVSHLYHDRDVFLRELISNSGDALEKLRFQSLTDSSVLDTAPALNISIITDKPSKRLIIRDSGVGMTREELQKNLGTIARSGTSEFLSKLEGSDDPKKSNTGSNLIGQFGLGFYSSFLVADRVLVASKSNADEKQWIFESRADVPEFKIAEDPRGTSLGRGTEITLYLKDDATEFLEATKLKELISTHSEFSTTSPIYIWTEKEEEVPIEEEEESSKAVDEEAKKDDESEDKPAKSEDETSESEEDEDLPKIDEDEEEDKDDADKPAPAPKTKIVKTQVWDQINTNGPIWTRDPKSVTDDEYISFYKGLTGKSEDPSSWLHFKGDAGRTAFHGLIFIPDTLPMDFYAKSYAQLDSVRLFVRKVLITKEPSPDFLPKWLNWIKVIVDADDLPLNVGRDSLQVTKSLRQIQNIILKKAVDHVASVAKKDPVKYAALWKKMGTTLKVGAVEDNKYRDKLAKLLRFQTSQSSNADDLVGLEDYVSRRKKNQKQIYYIAGAGVTVEQLKRSPFVEKLVARGYEVLYLTEPMDEMITSSLATFDGLKFQDVAKKGLEMGDENEDEEEKTSLEEFKKQYEPLSKWIKKVLNEFVADVVISNRLTTSPCAVVADSYAWTGNMERLMAAQGSRAGQEGNFMMDMIKKAKRVFEINPKHPLIQGLLAKVEEAGEDEEETTLSGDMTQVLKTLYDTSLVRSGFNVPDNDAYFERIEQLLRKSIGVGEDEKVDVGDIKPAPPVEEGPLDPRPPATTEESDDKIQFNSDGTTEKVNEENASWEDWSKVKEKLKTEKQEEVEKEEEVEKVKSEEKKEETVVQEKEEEIDSLDSESGEGEEEEEEDEEEESEEDRLKMDEELAKLMKSMGGEEGMDGLPDLKKMMKDFGLKDEL